MQNLILMRNAHAVEKQREAEVKKQKTNGVRDKSYRRAGLL